MPRTKRSRSPTTDRTVAGASAVSFTASAQTGEGNSGENIRTTRDTVFGGNEGEVSVKQSPHHDDVSVYDELRLMRHRLASAEAELAELRAKSNAIDTLLGEGFLGTKAVTSALDAHNKVDHNYAECSRAAVASRALRRNVVKVLSDAASADHAGLHEIDSDTFVRCHLPHDVVPNLVSEHVVVPYLEEDILVVLKPPKTSRGLSFYASSSSSSDDDADREPLSVLGSTAPVAHVLGQLKRIPNNLLKALLSRQRGSTLGPVDAAAKQKTLARFKTFLCGLCRRATLEELQCLGEWFTAVDPDKELLGLRTWCAVRCGNALPGPTGDFDAVDPLGEVEVTLLFTDDGRDEVFIPFAKNATTKRAAALLDIILSTLYGIPHSRIRNAAAVFLTASMRDDFFLPIVRAHLDNSTVAGHLPSILHILLNEATEEEATLFLTPTFRDEAIVALSDRVGTEVGAFVCALTRAAPDAARTLLCTADFRDDFFVEMIADEANEVEWLLEAVVHLVTPPSGGWREEIDPDPSSVFATEEFSEAFIVPAMSHLKDMDDDVQTVASSNIALLLARLSEVSGGIDIFLKPWKARMTEDAEFRSDGLKFLELTVAAIVEVKRNAQRGDKDAAQKPWYV